MANDYEALTQNVVDRINDEKALMKKLSDFKQGLESETSKMLDRFGEEDKQRAAHVAELLDQARKLAQGFREESSDRARSFARLLASAKAARNSAPRQNEKPKPAQPAKKTAAPAPAQDHAKALSAKKKKGGR